METVNPINPPSSLVERAKAILLHPREEWPRIETESDSAGEVFRRYAVPLAAIGPVASFIGGQVFGYGALGFTYRPGIGSAIGSLIVGYVMSLVGLFVLMFIADFLAPKFAGVSNHNAAFKLVAYSYTAAWVAGILGIVPALALIAALIGLYSFYLFYLGATPMMKVPADKAAGYTAVTVLCAIVLYLIVGALTASVTGLFGAGMLAHESTPSGTVSVPGVGTMDLGKMSAASKQMEAAANNKTPAVDPAKLQAFLPQSIGGYTRSSVETNAMGSMGAQATGTYTSGDKSFELQVADMSAMGALAGLGSALGVAQTREDADGYEKTGTVDGQMRSESWSKSGNRGKYAVVIDNRFAVQAEGTANNIDELKAAVAAVDQNRLAALAH